MAVEENDDLGIEPPTKGMIDIIDKQTIRRIAVAKGTIYLTSESIHHIRNGTNPKGNVLENAKLAAIMAVKQTPNLVFMCHPIKIRSTKVDFDVEDTHIDIEVEVIAEDKTGAEVEAMAGVMNGLLAIFDLCKRYEKDVDGQYLGTRISEVEVIKKVKEGMQ